MITNNHINNNENDRNSNKRGSSLKTSQFFYPQGSNNDYIMLLSIFPVESSFPCEHGTHEYAGCNRSFCFSCERNLLQHYLLASLHNL